MGHQAEPGYVLHSRPYRETSLLVDLFSRHQGRVRCVARGFRKPNKQGISRALFPYTEYSFCWQGQGELKTLSRADIAQAPAFLQRQSLFIGLYINELFYRLLHEHDPHEYLYQQYKQFMLQLADRGSDELMLRQIEMSLLQELGYGLVLDCDVQGHSIVAEQQYQYIPERGLMVLANRQQSAVGSYIGADLMALVQGDFSRRSVIKTARQLLRGVIDFYLAGRPLHSRELYRQHLASTDKELRHSTQSQDRSIK